MDGVNRRVSNKIEKQIRQNLINERNIDSAGQVKIEHFVIPPKADDLFKS